MVPAPAMSRVTRPRMNSSGEGGGDHTSHTMRMPYPGTALTVEPELAEVLREHRARLVAAKAPGFAQGWMFPSDAGTLRTPNTMDRAWAKCLDAAKVKHRFTVHGLRYTFTDLIRLSKANAVVRRELTGHVTQEMQQHDSNVGTDQKRAAIAGALKLLADTKAAAQNQLPHAHEPAGVNLGVNRGGVRGSTSVLSIERDTGFEPATFSLGS